MPTIKTGKFSLGNSCYSLYDYNHICRKRGGDEYHKKGILAGIILHHSTTGKFYIMHNYEVNLSWSESRKGIISSPDLAQSIEIATPPEFPKGIEGIWSPEHLFAAAVNSCLMTTFLAVAENSKLEFVSLNSNAIGKLDKVDGKYMMTEVVLRPILVIKNPEQQEKAKRVLEMSEKTCLISNSIKSAIVFEPIIKIG